MAPPLAASGTVTCTFPSATVTTMRSLFLRTSNAVPMACTRMSPTLTTKGRCGSGATRKYACPSPIFTLRRAPAN